MNKEYIKILEAIDKEGSMNSAASSIGISYKKLYTTLQKLKMVYDVKFVESSKGGYNGGGSTLTSEGRKVLETLKDQI